MKQIKYIFLLSIIFFACDEINPVNNFSNKYTFLCVLKNNQVIQTAYLYNVLDMESDFSYNTFYNDFIRDAEIIMSDGTISSQMQYRGRLPSSESITYSDDSVFHGRILPNKKYDIQIKINDEIITGSTTTPGGFAIHIPINNTIDLDKDADKEYIGSSLVYKYRFSWGESANSSHYIVYLGAIYKNESGSAYSFYQTINTVDTFAVIDIPEVHPNAWGHYPESAKIVVVSVDKNYYEYNILKRDRAGLNSGYGVFGSTIVDSCIVDIIR